MVLGHLKILLSQGLRPLPPAPFDSCGLAGCWLAGLQLAGRLHGWLALAGLLVGVPADFDWQDMQDWQGAGPK